MLNFVIKRIFSSIFVLIGVSFLVFFIARVIPGDPARIALGPMATEEQVQQLREELHLNDSFVSQYFRFIQNTVKGDLGQSLYTSQPVISDIADYLPATLELVFVAGLFMILLGIPLGVLGAKYEDSLLDHIIRIISLVGVAIPSFVWAVLLMLIFSYGLDLFPISGQINEEIEFEPITGFVFLDAVLLKNYDLFFSGIHHIILPSLALGASGIGQISRITRSNMIETYKKDYIKVTKIFHFNSFKVAFLYALRPSMIPVLTILGLDFAAMIGNAFLVEAVFNWPGFGNYTVEAIMNKDLNAIVATCILISAFFLVVNMIIDLMVAYVNPKIRLQGDI